LCEGAATYRPTNNWVFELALCRSNQVCYHRTRT